MPEPSPRSAPIRSARSCARRRSRRARQGCQRRDHGRRAQGGRGSRDREDRRKQEEVGLQLATDGEFRRSWWHFDFCWGLDGCEMVSSTHGIQFQGVQTQGRRASHHRQARLPADHPMLEHFRFLKAHTSGDAEDDASRRRRCCISGWPQGRHQKSVYPDMRRVLCRSRQDLAKAVQGLLRRRLPLSAVRRHRLGLSLLAGRAADGARARGDDGGQAAADLCTT